jgi:hypothetical protein
MTWFGPSSILFWAASGTLALCAPISFGTHQLPWAAVGSDYRVTIQTRVDGNCPRSDARILVTAGSLPAGLELQGDWLTGVPKELGTFRFRLRGASFCAAAERDYVLVVTARPVLRLNTEEIVFEYRMGDPAPEAQSVLVAGTWPDLPYSVNATVPWLRAQPELGATPLSGAALGADRVSVRVMTRDLSPGTYEGRLMFVAQQSATALSIPVKLRVVAAP